MTVCRDGQKVTERGGDERVELLFREDFEERWLLIVNASLEGGHEFHCDRSGRQDPTINVMVWKNAGLYIELRDAQTALARKGREPNLGFRFWLTRLHTARSTNRDSHRLLLV